MWQSCAIFSGSQILADEELRIVRERAQFLMAGNARPRANLTHEPRRQADAPEVFRDDERSHFGHSRRQRREFDARFQIACDCADDEACRVLA